MKKIECLLAGAFSCALASAQAGTMGEVIDIWSGPYAGLSIEAGAGRGKQSLTHQIVTRFTNPPSLVFQEERFNGSASLSGLSTGGVANLLIGYNARSSNFIYGLQLSGNLFNSMDLKTSGIMNAFRRTETFVNGVSVGGAQQNYDFDINAGIRPTELITLSGRAGVLLRPTTLFYGLIGATGGRFADRPIFSETSRLGDDVIDTYISNHIDNRDFYWRLGLTAGTGIEHKFNEHWSIFGEYHFMYFSFTRNISKIFSDGSGPLNQPFTGFDNITLNRTIHTNINLNSAAVGVIYRI